MSLKRFKVSYCYESAVGGVNRFSFTILQKLIEIVIQVAKQYDVRME